MSLRLGGLPEPHMTRHAAPTAPPSRVPGHPDRCPCIPCNDTAVAEIRAAIARAHAEPAAHR